MRFVLCLTLNSLNELMLWKVIIPMWLFYKYFTFQLKFRKQSGLKKIRWCKEAAVEQEESTPALGKISEERVLPHAVPVTILFQRTNQPLFHCSIWSASCLGMHPHRHSWGFRQVFMWREGGFVSVYIFIEPDNLVNLLPLNMSVIGSIVFVGIKDSPCFKVQYFENKDGRLELTCSGPAVTRLVLKCPFSHPNSAPLLQVPITFLC